MQISLRRFLAFAALACWLPLTAVMVQTALEWSKQETEERVAFQQQHEIGESAEDSMRAALASTPMTETEAERKIRSAQQRILKSFNELGDKALSASRAAQTEKRKFWWELSAWVLLSLAASALLAEPSSVSNKSKVDVGN